MAVERLGEFLTEALKDVPKNHTDYNYLKKLKTSNDNRIRKVNDEKLAFSVPELAVSFIKENFSGVNFEEIKEKRNNSNGIPIQALERSLYFEKRLSINAISKIVHRRYSSVRNAIEKSEEDFNLSLENWHKSKVRITPKIDREKQEKKERDQVFAKIALEVVANSYDETVEGIFCKSRKKRFTQPRKTAQYIIFTGTDYSLSEISGFVGRSDHTTAINAIATVVRRLDYDEEFKERLEAMQKKINELTETALKQSKAQA